MKTSEAKQCFWCISAVTPNDSPKELKSFKKMRKPSATVIAVILLSALFCAAQKPSSPLQIHKFVSPDGKLVAFIRSKKAPEATNESRIELRTRNGTVLAKRDYSSENAEHGFAAIKAVWTPNSEFFVYSLESSGGHSAWHSPVQFFSRKEKKIIGLDDAVKDAVMNPQFGVSAPDRLTVELWFSKEMRTVSLHDLRTPGSASV